MPSYYLDIETYSKGKKPDPVKDKIISIQYQRIDDRTGQPIGSLKILKEWESSEEQIIQAFLEDFKLEDVWNFIPIGCSLIQYDLFVLYHRSKKYNIQIDIYKLFREQPIIDIKPILVLLNKMKFKGSSLHNFTKKKTSGENIWSLYENKNYGEIVQYVIEEAKAFMDLFGWLFNSFPDFFRKDYLINNKNSKSNNRNLQENKGGIKCPECGSTFLEKFNELQDGMGIDAMTEGQLAEYLAGTWGTYTCLKCGHDFDYET